MSILNNKVEFAKKIINCKVAFELFKKYEVKCVKSSNEKKIDFQSSN